MVEFYDTEEKITLKDIEKLEKELKFIFPESYKNHLLRYNGGRCEPNVFQFIENGKITHSDLNWFLGVHNEKYYQLKDDFIDFKIEQYRMPYSIFPIANDSGGNQICMDAEDEKIYFWDHENEVDYSIYDDAVRTNLHFVANSLKEFLNNLKSIDDTAFIQELKNTQKK